VAWAAKEVVALVLRLQDVREVPELLVECIGLNTRNLLERLMPVRL
jgi:hypothetical protein